MDAMGDIDHLLVGIALYHFLLFVAVVVFSESRFTVVCT